MPRANHAAIRNARARTAAGQGQLAARGNGKRPSAHSLLARPIAYYYQLSFQPLQPTARPCRPPARWRPSRHLGLGGRSSSSAAPRRARRCRRRRRGGGAARPPPPRTERRRRARAPRRGGGEGSRSTWRRRGRWRGKRTAARRGGSRRWSAGVSPAAASPPHPRCSTCPVRTTIFLCLVTKKVPSRSVIPMCGLEVRCLNILLQLDSDKAQLVVSLT